MKKRFERLSISTKIGVGFFVVESIALIMGLSAALYIWSIAKSIWFLLLILVLSVMGILLAQLFARRLSNVTAGYILKVTDGLHKLAEGDLDYFVNDPKADQDSQDETMKMREAFMKLLNNTREKVRDEQQAAAGDLTTWIHINGEKDQLGNAMLKMVMNTHRVVKSIVAAADKVAMGAETLSYTSMQLAQGTTEEASTIQQLSASLDEVASQTSINAGNAEKADEFAQNARTAAEKGDGQMKAMLEAMETIARTSGAISNIVKTIDDIAFQTNILALNASVEAARAGQHGKGFAVVANEVRTLAGRTAEAVKETTELITDSGQKVQAGMKIAQDTAQALNEIVSSVQRSATAVDAIAASSKEQAANIDQIRLGIQQISEVVQTGAASAEESAAAIEDLAKQAAKMKKASGAFILEKKTE